MRVPHLIRRVRACGQPSTYLAPITQADGCRSAPGRWGAGGGGRERVSSHAGPRRGRGCRPSGRRLRASSGGRWCRCLRRLRAWRTRRRHAGRIRGLRWWEFVPCWLAANGPVSRSRCWQVSAGARVPFWFVAHQPALPGTLTVAAAAAVPVAGQRTAGMRLGSFSLGSVIDESTHSSFEWHGFLVDRWHYRCCRGRGLARRRERTGATRRRQGGFRAAKNEASDSSGADGRGLSTPQPRR